MNTLDRLMDEDEKRHNLRVLKNRIKELIAYEPNLDAKLNMLTEIALTTQNDEVWEQTEEIRSEICACPDETLENEKSSLLPDGYGNGENGSEILHQGLCDADAFCSEWMFT